MYGHDFTKKKRVIVKVGSSTITHDATGNIDYTKFYVQFLPEQVSDSSFMNISNSLIMDIAISGKGFLGFFSKARRSTQRFSLYFSFFLSFADF